MKLGRKKCPQCQEMVAVARKNCLNCSYCFRKSAVCLRGMTSSRLRTKAYEAVREKTIFPLIARVRQQSQNMDQMKLDESASSSGEGKIPVLTYHKDEEKENSCSTHVTDQPGSAPAVEGSNDLVIEEELDAGVVPNVDVLMTESEPYDPEPTIDVTSPHDDMLSPTPDNIIIQTPTASSSSPASQPANSKTFKFHDNTFETMKALEQIQGQFKQSQSWQSTEQSPSNNSSSNTSLSSSPKVEGYLNQTPTIVPRKRGRPKGSTTKNRKIKNIGGLNLWAPKSSKSKLSTLELLAMSAQRQHTHQQSHTQQNDSQAMLALLMQQQLQQQMMSVNSTQDAMQLLMACDASFQQAYSEQQQHQALLAQQQLMMNAQNEQKMNSAQTNHLLEMQLQHEISNLEKILANHAAEHKINPSLAPPKVPQTMDLGMYQLSNIASHSPVQASLSGVSNPQVLKFNSVPSADQFQSSVSESLQKEAQQNALLRETMMKLQGQSLQSSSSHISPNGIFSTANNGLNHSVPQSVSSSDQNHHIMGYSPSLPHSVWSSSTSLENIPAAPVQTAAGTISPPIIQNNTLHHKMPAVNSRPGDVSDDVTKQFLELIKSLGNDPVQTEQLLQLLAGQVTNNSQHQAPGVSSAASHVPTIFSQNRPLPSQSVPAPAQLAPVQLAPAQLAPVQLAPAQLSPVQLSPAPAQLAPAPPAQPTPTTSHSSPTKSGAQAKMSDLEQLISCLKSPNQQKVSQSIFTPKIKSGADLDNLLPKTRGRPPGTSNGTPTSLKQSEGKRHRGRPRKYPEHFYNVVNGKMKYPGAKERRMFFPFEETKYNNSSSTAGLTQLNQANFGSLTSSTEEQTGSTSGQEQSPVPPTDNTLTPPPPPAKKRGRPKGSKNKPCLITSPQQLLDLRAQYPESSPVWAGMPDCKQAQIAAVLSGLNHKLFRQNPSFTV
ncbi:uncharacterized protein LOC134825465 isoform X2 [Bolinopsis microptera]|uniref:uncharacterized protein LOC134825465 isoform X2 n=1 Tax=Bolinopsis microptera TaxID=2820187 RepID=UPI00307955F5